MPKNKNTEQSSEIKCFFTQRLELFFTNIFEYSRTLFRPDLIR